MQTPLRSLILSLDDRQQRIGLINYNYASRPRLKTTTMTRRIRDLLPDSEQSAISKLTRCLDDDGPVVVWLCGPVGAGKSDLLAEFAASAETRDATICKVDCRIVEPTVTGLLSTLGILLQRPVENLEQAADLVSAQGQRVVIAFENYEVFRLADSWLRRDFIPALSDSVRVILISREPPTAGWVSATEWHDYFQTVSLQAAEEADTDVLLQRCLEEAPQQEMREALDAASVVRRVTIPMIAALMGDDSAGDIYERLSGLSFVETRQDGLAITDSIRRLIADRLQAADVERYRHYQKAAWKLLRQQLKDSSRADLWRCTADIIYLVENPVIREAFFPSESAQFSVEPAVAADEQDILDITAAHEPEAAVDAMRLWWRHLPTAFHVIRDSAGVIAGYSCVALPDDLDANWMQSDPVARQWQHHINLKGRSSQPPSLFLRRWLSRDVGEAACAMQAAAWVDVKRTYLELRPELRRVYLTLQDIAPYGAAATQLGFVVCEELDTNLGDVPYYSAMLDFGPGSVDGWICNLLAAELGIVEEQLLDSGARELVVDGARIPLTPLEFSLVSMLEARNGEAVSRAEILQQVWGHSYDGGSNVVDAAVRGLRKKCGTAANMFETVRGVGYRLRT